jgi:hypothetical protein
MRSVFVLSLAALVIVPTVATAQRGRTTHTTTTRVTARSYDDGDCCYANRFSLEPYAGAIKDAYDIGAEDDTGYLLGFRVGYRLGSRTRLIGNFGYSNTENVADPGPLTSYYIYDNVWVMTTGGGEFDVVPGRTSASLGLQAGVAWRKLDLEGSVGAPPFSAESTDRFTAYEVLLPSLMVRHRLSSRTTAVAGIQDHIFNLLEGTAQHSPALTLGFSFR